MANEETETQFDPNFETTTPEEDLDILLEDITTMLERIQIE